MSPKDTQAMGDSLNTLLKDKDYRVSLGNAARARMEQCFAWDVVAAQYGMAYKQIIM